MQHPLTRSMAIANGARLPVGAHYNQADVSKKKQQKDPRRRLVPTTAAKLRALILARDPGSQIGSLTELAELLGVGVVTLQQAARILEHEGLLLVRRGPGGGYYGTRPDEAALERSVVAYLQVHGSGHREAAEVMTLLRAEIISAASHCKDPELREALTVLDARIDLSDTADKRAALEKDLYQLLFKMVARPLFELLTRVAWRLYDPSSIPALYPGEEGVAAWKAGKRRLIRAILEQDEELARFEAMRDRQDYLARLSKTTA
jgi:GntR family transcriptional regulator, transcriptional repressor for pyruvate dehydrogenase complex